MFRKMCVAALAFASALMATAVHAQPKPAISASQPVDQVNPQPHAPFVAVQVAPDLWEVPGAGSNVTRATIPGHPGANSKPPGGSFRDVRGPIPKGAVPLSEAAWSQPCRVHERDDGATVDAEDSRGS